MEIISRAVRKFIETPLGPEGCLEVQLSIQYLVGERTLTLIIVREFTNNIITYHPPVEIKGLLTEEYKERRIHVDDVIVTIKKDTVDMTDLVRVYLYFGMRHKKPNTLTFFP